ncbi:MAG: dihydroxyacetone kinase subunit DhaK [Dyella sp.]
MDFFFNQTGRVVDQMIGSLARLAPLELSEPTSGVRILARADWRKTQVAILSGGGAGHEPSHAGFVGPGMLTAAVSGELFASPSVAAVLAALRHCSGDAGALLVVKNYTGDRLNFGLAAEQARREGLNVRMVIVADDIALPEAPRPRGIAGTVLMHKYVGYLADRGLPLDEIATHAERFSGQLMSLGMALSSCTLPGHAIERRSPELGLGIHNEPGAQQVTPADAAEAVAIVLQPLLAEAAKRYGADARLIVMLNQLGGCSTQELGVLADELLSQIGLARIALMVRPAPLMTSLDMHGFSISLLPAEPEYLEAIAAAVDTPAWPGVYQPHPPRIFTVASDVRADVSVGARNAAIETAIRRATAALIGAQSTLDALDARSGDGDAGSTFAAGARAVEQQLAAAQFSSGEPARLCDELGRLLAHSMGGSSGVLLSIFFTAAGTALAAGKSWPGALADGIARMQHYGGAQRGDRTMLDALIPAIDALSEGQDLRAAAQAARRGADHTATITHARAGRASYVPDYALAGAADPGAEAVALALSALAGD